MPTWASGHLQPDADRAPFCVTLLLRLLSFTHAATCCSHSVLGARHIKMPGARSVTSRSRWSSHEGAKSYRRGSLGVLQAKGCIGPRKSFQWSFTERMPTELAPEHEWRERGWDSGGWPTPTKAGKAQDVEDALPEPRGMVPGALRARDSAGQWAMPPQPDLTLPRLRSAQNFVGSEIGHIWL